MTARQVEIRNLDHTYTNDPVLHDVTLDVAAGESLALLGPSGCGKTTLLRVIAGLERPSAGTVTIGDDVVAGDGRWVPPDRRRVGMVFQDWALFPHLTVADNVGYGLGRSERFGPRVTEALDLVGLADLTSRMPATLSGGQQQRVALARALAPRPSVLLLDEPFSNLDASMRVELRTEVHRLLHELGITAVFVTHDQEEAFVLGDQVAVMRDGRVVQVGSPHDIYLHPADRRVAEFVGAGTLLEATVLNGHARSIVGDVPVAAQDGPVDLLVRPEELRLEAGGPGVVEFVEYYGHDSMVFVRLGDTTVQVRCEPGVRPQRGQAVAVSFTGDQAVTFDPTS